ncbi:PHP domain-containing protein [Candidatus Parcubacteria bacterium]|nr:PHP domain-containing protein [Candidatus Parcubacteria bacterium]
MVKKEMLKITKNIIIKQSNNMLIDLQLHSTYSDGYLTPTELVKYLKSRNIKIAALTDHNTVGVAHEFKKMCKQNGIKPIIGIELYVKLGNKKFNILWYNFDYNSPDLHDMLRGSQMRRRKMFRSALKRLVMDGFKIDINKTLDKYNHYVPLNHVTDDILANKFNYNKIKKELKVKIVLDGDVINEYLRNKKVGKLQNSYLDINRVFRLRKKIGGQVVLCHPAKHHYLKEDFLIKLKKLGLDGIEILSPHHSYGAVMNIQFLARKLDLIETGGSDFHRFEGGNYPVQSSSDYFSIDAKYLRRIKEII